MQTGGDFVPFPKCKSMLSLHTLEADFRIHPYPSILYPSTLSIWRKLICTYVALYNAFLPACCAVQVALLFPGFVSLASVGPRLSPTLSRRGSTVSGFPLVSIVHVSLSVSLSACTSQVEESSGLWVAPCCTQKSSQCEGFNISVSTAPLGLLVNFMALVIFSTLLGALVHCGTVKHGHHMHSDIESHYRSCAAVLCRVRTVQIWCSKQRLKSEEYSKSFHILPRSLSCLGNLILYNYCNYSMPLKAYNLQRDLNSRATALVLPTPLYGGHGSGKKGAWRQKPKISLMYMYMCI
jgi:hypothetical protein